VTRRTVAAQADDFFTKPLDMERLQLRIADLMERG
jgi:DNA-binding response OmpR family regulator